MSGAEAWLDGEKPSRALKSLPTTRLRGAHGQLGLGMRVCVCVCVCGGGGGVDRVRSKNEHVPTDVQIS